MPLYKLSADAKSDLKRIYKYGCEVFGEAQADQYFEAFFERFAILADDPFLYPAAEEIGSGVRKSVCGRDTIYYELTDDGVIIQFILGRQDIAEAITRHS